MKHRTQRKYRDGLSPIWYWGIHAEWGKVFGWKRSELCPHIVIRPPINTAYCGWDVDRGRFVIRPIQDPGIYRLGWRKKAFRR